MKSKFILCFIFLVAIFLRFVLLDKFPPSLNWDEVSHGYNAYSILLTGKDEWGEILPLTNFRAYGDYPLPLNLYLTVPFIKLLGLNAFAIRFPHALLGSLTVITSYYLAYGLTKKKTIALLTALFVAIDPWTFFTSRFVLQSNLSIFLLTLSACLFVNRQKVKICLPLSVLSLGLTLFSYHTTRIFSPLLLLTAVLIYRDSIVLAVKKTKITFLVTAILILVFFVPLPFVLMNPQARARSSVVFLVDEGAIAKIIDWRNGSTLPNLVKKIIYNRPTYFIAHFSKNYLDYFSPEFLFLNGGTQYQFSIPKTGLLYLVNLPFFYLGLLFVFKKSFKDRNYQLILAWLLLAPIPASMTQERFAVLRSTTLLPLPQLLSALGLVVFVDWLKVKSTTKRIVFVFYFLYAGLLIYGMGKYLVKYFGDYPKNYSWAWQYGYKEVALYAQDNYSKYDKIIISKKYGEPHEFILFYNSWSPVRYMSDPNLIRFGQSNWYWVDHFDKYYFVNDWQVVGRNNKKFILESKAEIDCTLSKCLLISSPGNVPQGWSKLKSINFLDEKQAFEIYEN